VAKRRSQYAIEKEKFDVAEELHDAVGKLVGLMRDGHATAPQLKRFATAMEIFFEEGIDRRRQTSETRWLRKFKQHLRRKGLKGVTDWVIDTQLKYINKHAARLLRKSGLNLLQVVCLTSEQGFKYFETRYYIGKIEDVLRLNGIEPCMSEEQIRSVFGKFALDPNLRLVKSAEPKFRLLRAAKK